MFQVSAEFIGMLGEAALIVKGSMIVFANSKARSLLGIDCVGKSLKTLFGKEIAEIQGSSYIVSTKLSGKSYIIRVVSSDGAKVLFLSDTDSFAPLLSDALISHLKSSLMATQAALDSMRGALFNSSDMLLHSQLSVLTHEIFKISRMIMNVSVISNLDKGLLNFDPQEFDLVKLLRGLARSATLLSEAPNILLTMPEKLTVSADPDLLTQLVYNLLSNSIRHAKGCSRISLSVMEHMETVVISVDDDGCGINRSELYSVFDRYRHSFTMSDMSNGAGFGLTVARAIAEMHGGGLLLESREDSGTTVRVYFSKEAGKVYRDYVPKDDYAVSLRNTLIGLADCLPDERFNANYLDLIVPEDGAPQYP